MRGFVDLHLHVSLTDHHGACGEAACQELMLAAEQLGVRALVITPHLDAYQQASVVQPDLEATLACCQAVTPNVVVGAGSEFLIRAPTDVLLPLQGKVLTLLGTRHLLIEFLPQTELDCIADCLYELKLRKFIPLIAHPERLLAISRQPERAKRLVDAGALLQGTLSSLVGNQGSRARDALLALLRQGYVHSLASDYHGGDYAKLVSQAQHVLERRLSLRLVEQLCIEHPSELVGELLATL